MGIVDRNILVFSHLADEQTTSSSFWTQSLDKRPENGNGNMVRQLGYFVLPSVCCHNYSHVNEFNWLSRPNTNFFASALRCQTPRGLLLHLKRNQRAGEESIFPDSCPVIWQFLLCFISPLQCLIETRTDMLFNSNRDSMLTIIFRIFVVLRISEKSSMVVQSMPHILIKGGSPPD